MNRLASKPQPRRASPRIVATLDLSDELQRELHGFFQRMHTGRWPTLRTLALRQAPDGTLIEAAEWLRQKRSHFAVVEWAVRDGRLTWRCHPNPSQRAAITAMRAMLARSAR
jgi:hypothetical protein